MQIIEIGKTGWSVGSQVLVFYTQTIPLPAQIEHDRFAFAFELRSNSNESPALET